MDYIPPPSRDCVAAVVYTEARGELLLGQILVAKTLINRAVRSGDGLCETASLYRQFHGFEAVRWPNDFKPDQKAWKISRKVGDFTLEFLWNVHTYCGEPLYFNSGPIKRPAKDAVFLCTVGSHNFYGVHHDQP